LNEAGKTWRGINPAVLPGDRPAAARELAFVPFGAPLSFPNDPPALQQITEALQLLR
jgi:hypothetical protein